MVLVSQSASMGISWSGVSSKEAKRLLVINASSLFTLHRETARGANLVRVHMLSSS